MVYKGDKFEIFSMLPNFNMFQTLWKHLSNASKNKPMKQCPSIKKSFKFKIMFVVEPF
jgi:hypothetical protein